MKKIKSILLVEDDDISRMASANIITNCILDIAVNASAALPAINENTYALILTDLCLDSGIDGYEFAKQIRCRKDAKKNIPIIALTTFVSDDIIIACNKVKINSVIQKPLTYEKYMKILKEFNV